MLRNRIIHWSILVILSGAFVLLVSEPGWWETALRFILPNQISVLYPSASLLSLVVEHIRMVLVSSAITIIIGIPLAILVSHSWGANFLPIVNDLTALGQTIPPVAVLALAVPLFGFGLMPVTIALFLYGLLPVVRNTITGIRGVSANVVEAAHGMGMTDWQTLMNVEFPLAAPVILAGVRTSIIINVGTAMVGAVIGAGGLGAPIIAGIVEFNTAYIIEGALPAAIMAILLDQLLANFENTFVYSFHKNS